MNTFFFLGSYIFIALISVSFVVYIRSRITKMTGESTRVRLLQIIMEAIYLPFILLVLMQLVYYVGFYFFEYFDSTIVGYVMKTKKICFVWMSWLAIVRFNKQFNSCLNDGLILKNIKDKSVLVFFSKAFTFIGYFVMFLLILNVFDVSIMKLLTLVGAPTLVIGYASQNVIKNCISGISILINGPFKINDLIDIPSKGIEGCVVKIGIRMTQILTSDKKVLYVPNSVFDDASIINNSQSTSQMILLEILIDYGDYRIIPKIIDDVNAILDNHDKINHKISSLVCSDNINDSALVLTVKAFATTNSLANMKMIKQDLLLKIIEIIENDGGHIYQSWEYTNHVIIDNPTINNLKNVDGNN